MSSGRSGQHPGAASGAVFEDVAKPRRRLRPSLPRRRPGRTRPGAKQPGLWQGHDPRGQSGKGFGTRNPGRARTATAPRPRGGGDIGVPALCNERRRNRRAPTHSGCSDTLPAIAHVIAARVRRGKARRSPARFEGLGPPGQSPWPPRVSSTTPAIRKPVMRAICRSASAISASRLFSSRRPKASMMAARSRPRTATMKGKPNFSP